MKFYGMVGHNPGTSQLDFESPYRLTPRSRSLEVRGQTVLWITPFQAVVEGHHQKN